MKPFRYLLLVKTSGDFLEPQIRAISARTGLPVVYRSTKLVLMASDPGDVLRLPDGGGLIVGKLFHRHGYPEQVRQLPLEAETILLASGGRHLVERYWGSYVAALELDDGTICVMRDPSGGLPCYYARVEGGTGFTSDAPILCDAGLVEAIIDWRMVGRALLFHHLPAEETAIDGLCQVLGGCALLLSPGSVKKQQYWSPWNYIGPVASQRSWSNEERLRQAVSMAIKAWSSCFSQPIVSLSGGLDSSIVAACLAGAGAQMSCVTLTSNEPLGDERRYAREVCEAIKAQLLEMPYRQDAIDLDCSVAAGLPVPCGKLQEQAHNLAVREAVERFGADALFVGAGGDNVFYSTHSARSLVDRYDEEGWSRGTAATLSDIAAITGASLWQVAREAYRLTHPRAEQMQWLTHPDFLDQDFIEAEAGKPMEHPWFNAARSTPLGKLGHVKLLLRAMNHMEHRDKGLAAPLISPLLSQPVIETCLSIPSWEFVEGGVDRSVARRAFAPILPARIIGRAGKGSPDGFIAQFVERHRAVIAARLLDGLLARQGLIDRPALEKALSSKSQFAEGDCARLMGLLDTEAWARHWSRKVAAPKSHEPPPLLG